MKVAQRRSSRKLQLIPHHVAYRAVSEAWMSRYDGGIADHGVVKQFGFPLLLTREQVPQFPQVLHLDHCSIVIGQVRYCLK